MHLNQAQFRYICEGFCYRFSVILKLPALLISLANLNHLKTQAVRINGQRLSYEPGPQLYVRIGYGYE